MGIPTLIAEGDLETYLDIDPALAGRMAKWIPIAAMHLRRIKGMAWYVAVLGLHASDDLVGLAKHAEALVTLREALPHLGLRFSPAGGIVVTEWTDITGGKLEQRFANFATLEAAQRHLLEQAKLLVDGDVRIEQDKESSLITGIDGTGGFSLHAIGSAVDEAASAGKQATGDPGSSPGGRMREWKQAVPDAVLRVYLKDAYDIESVEALAAHTGRIEVRSLEVEDITGLRLAVLISELILEDLPLSSVREVETMRWLTRLEIIDVAQLATPPNVLALVNLKFFVFRGTASETDLLDIMAIQLSRNRMVLGALGCHMDLRGHTTGGETNYITPTEIGGSFGVIEATAATKTFRVEGDFVGELGAGDLVEISLGANDGTFTVAHAPTLQKDSEGDVFTDIVVEEAVVDATGYGPGFYGLEVAGCTVLYDKPTL